MIFESLLALALTQANAAGRPLVAPPNQWIVDYSQTACTLARRQGDAHSPVVAFNASLGREPGELVILEAGTALESQLSGELQVRVDNGEPLTIRAQRDVRNGHRVTRLVPMPDDFLDRLAAGHELVLAKRGQAVLTLGLPNARGAVEQLTRCNDDLLQSWGIDIAARRALSRKPHMRNYDWAFQIMPGRDTNLIFVANISERGRPLDCRVVLSSRNPEMDQAVCNRMRQLARFEPALDAGGRPAAAQYVTRIRWMVDVPED